MHSLCFFNNKGGVGKTTLVCNIGAFLASNYSKRVLLLDLDPQCNATQLILGENRLLELFGDGNDGGDNTMLAVVKPLLMGESSISPQDVTPLPAEDNRFGISLIPGHPRVAMIEDKLGADWGDIPGGDVGAFRRSNWFNALLESHSPHYDILVVDVGPSLGAINRSVLIGCDFLLTPMGCDIFSLIGIGNIAEWMNSWFTRYRTGLKQLAVDHPTAVNDYSLVSGFESRCRLIGYTVQQYITKSKGGIRRPTAAYEQIRYRIPSTISTKLAQLIDPKVADRLDLGDIPHMYSLVPLSQSANVPIDKLGSADGLAGSQYQKQIEYLAVMRSLCDRLVQSLDIMESGEE